MVTSQLPIRLRPYVDESLPSYLCRLATSNGWGNLPEFLVVMGIKQTKVDPFFNLGQLAQLVNIQEMDLQHYLEQIPKSMPGRMFYQHSPRLCPICIQSTPYIRHSEHYQIDVFCDKHHCRRIDRCPTCELPLQWQRYLFTGCANCNMTWAELSVSNDIDMDYQHWIRMGEHETKMELLYEAIMRLIYPTDLDPLALSHAFELNSHIIIDAFYLLQGRYDEIWRARCREDRHYLSLFGEHHVYKPMTSISNLLGLPACSNTAITTWPSYAQQHRVDKYPQINVPLVFRASSFYIRQLVGLTPTQLDILEQSGHFNSLYHISNRRHRTYDMRQIFRWFRTRMCSDTCDYYPPISFKKLMMMHGIEFGLLFEGMHQGKFRFTLCPEKDAMILKVAVEDVKPFVLDNEVFDPLEDKSQKWVARRLKIQLIGVKSLLRPGLLACTRNQAITRSSLHSFLLSYSSLQRWCYLNRYKLSGVKSVMKSAQIVPVFTSPLCILLTHVQLAELTKILESREDLRVKNNPKWVL
ncbi:TniQ family protein [Shewanella sp. 6_MG-2023]|uniref:TniQ family protein n=1 Tax=Shewanella sp. 6_MG-2023 TaxID=3062660 RepID=UPI0026E268C3|nr:TniQ family protein [Shewanella sp. 6_MG-2023]MDO6620151.1 TniQ family protein [Shewanella sp. 6_MG-2023]